MSLKTIAEPLYHAKGWMKFLGIVSIISGGLSALTIFGIVIAWLPIWMGVLLFQAVGKIDAAYIGEDEVLLSEALGKIKTFFVLSGVLMLIYLLGNFVLLFGGLVGLRWGG